MANYLELDINSGIIHQKNPISAGDTEVAEDTTNAGKIVATNANGKLDNSFLPWAVNVVGSISLAGTDYVISNEGDIYAYGDKLSSFADATQYDRWNDESHICVDYSTRQLLPRSEYDYPASLDWSDENFLKTRGIDDKEGLNWGFFKKQDFSAGDLISTGMILSTAGFSGGSYGYLPVDFTQNNGTHTYLYLSTLTSPAGSSHSRGVVSIKLASIFATYEWGARVQTPNLSDETNSFNVQIGLQNSTNSTQTLSSYNHIIFYYNQSTYSDNNWRAITRKSDNSETVTDTGVTVSTTDWQRLRFMFDSNNSAARVRFYIDDTLVATHTTNIPESTAIRPRVCIMKTGGATARTFRIDNIWHCMKFLSRQSRV